MSYQLAFWKSAKSLQPSKVYARLAAGKRVRGLDPVDARDVERRLIGAFRGWTVEESLASGSAQTLFSAESSALEVFYTPQGVICTCHGMSHAQFNDIIDVMHALSAPLYDPQTQERFG